MHFHVKILSSYFENQSSSQQTKIFPSNLRMTPSEMKPELRNQAKNLDCDGHEREGSATMAVNHKVMTKCAAGNL